MPLTTHSGCQSKAPLRADQVSTSKDGNEAHSCPGPKSANVPHAQPKPRPLPRSKHSDPSTSSAEEDIFFSNFARHSFISNKSNKSNNANDMDNDTQQVEGISPAVMNERETTPTQSDGEHSSNVAMNNTTAPSNTDGPANADSMIQTNKRENPTAHRPHRSGAQKSYLPSDEGKFVESFGSDSDWAATEEQ
ncbi:hypothetical protein BDR04DRAFT_1123695 [Suillus decipiens]|nr:hypothetical protein BDR04DRAFT_1123695 [Suillus decipiens]